MSDLPLLAGLREELIQLAARVVRANARVEVVGSQLRESSGSAWLFADRLWVTNYHVVDDARGKVTLTNGGQQIHGEVIGKDADTDLAVIRAIESIEVKPLLLRSGAAQLGELCFAIGAPLGDYADTMSMGIVSGLNRRLPQGDGRVLEDMLQTDTAINHGNSGGPLVDADGCVLGVNTAGIDSANNIGFAVPVHTVADIVPELIESGTIARATFGAKIDIRKSGISQSYDFVILASSDSHGLLRPGDILREINGRPLRHRADLMSVMRRDVIDRSVPLVIERDGKKQTISVTPQRRQK
jgi:S1-C subfamily serine protease